MIKCITEDEIHEAYILFKVVVDTMSSLPSNALLAYQQQWAPERLKAMLQVPGNILLASHESDQSLNGFLFGTASEGGVATIIWLGVKPSCQRQGIGRQLVTEAVNQYRTAGCHKLKLFTESESARLFYQRIGFVLEGSHENHWWHRRFWSLAKFIGESDNVG